MKRLLLLTPVVFLAACPKLGTLPSPAETPNVGANSDILPSSDPGAPDVSPAAGIARLRSAPVPADYKDIPQAPLHWEAPLISSFADTIAPGAVVYWVPDSSLPLASAQFVWNEGRLALNPRQDAAAGLLGRFLRDGGTATYSPARIDDTLEFLAANASISIGMVRSTASVGGLSRDLHFLIDLLGEMLTAPRFDTARLSTIKQERIQDIEHAFDTPAQCMGLAWDRVAYGPSAWTTLTDSANVRNLSVEDFRNALRGRFASGKVLVSVAGSYDKAAVRAQLITLLERLRKGAAQPVARLDSIAPIPDLRDRGVWIQDIPATQANIRIGTRFIQRDHPDFYPLMLASEVLGQAGFGSRLVERVRSNEGLAYFVRSFVNSEYDRPGMIGVNLQTKVPSTGRALKIILEEMKLLADSGFRPGELEKARQGLIASAPSLFDTPENTADIVLQSAAWKRRDDHFRMYVKALDTIPAAEVLRVYRKWFVPDSMRIVVAGPASEMRRTFPDGSPGLDSYGPVRIWNPDSLRAK